jgi:VWFA-related protein
MVEQARRRDVLVYPVILQRTVPQIFGQLADVTGGRAIAVRDSGSIGMLLSGIATELRAQYLLGYTPPAVERTTSSWRTITVRVNRPGLQVRARDGYATAR